MNNRRQGIVTILALTAFLVSVTPPAWTQQASRQPSLFVAAPHALVEPADRQFVLRSRVVYVDLDVLSHARVGDVLAVSPFEDVPVLAVIEKTEKTRRWSGTLVTDPPGRFTLVLHKGSLAGVLTVPGVGHYRIRTQGVRLHVIEELDAGAFPGCRGAAKPDQGAHEPAQPVIDDLACYEEDGSILDVLVVYTPVARSGMGGTSAIEAEIDLAITLANEAYANSSIAPNLNLVHKAEISYDENGTYLEHLERLTYTSDGYMDSVHQLRDDYRADLVALIVDDLDEYCGIAWIGGDDTYAFSVTTWDCIATDTFAHEVGHNQGCCHALGDGGGCDNGGLFEYSNGHRFTGNSGTEWRTVMAYSPGTRISHFSTPDVSYDGQPTGIAEGAPDAADNARTIDETAYTVANYRTPTPVPSRLYVDVGAVAGGCGTSWSDALTSLQDALALAPTISVNEIWVAAGTYSPAPPAGDRLVSFALLENTRLFGGFAGWETLLEERDWVTNETVLSGDLNGDDGPGFVGYDENSHHVVRCISASSSVLDGFVITGGNADEGDNRGGGIYIIGFDPTIRNCRIVANTAWLGGGLYAISGSPTILNCAFIGNEGAISGGIDMSNAATATIANCTVTANSASGNNPGGVRSLSPALALYNSVLWANSNSGGTSQQAQLIDAVLGMTIEYSCVQGWTGSLGGVGNHGLNPLFQDLDGLDGLPGTLDDDVRLAPGSPCIDAADNTRVPPDAHDLDSDGDTSEPTPLDLNANARFVDDFFTPDSGLGSPPVVDVGAYEFQGCPVVTDCNANMLDDACEIAAGLSSDCNSNQVPDDCDISQGTSIDCNGDLIPDECQTADCNGNGVLDACDVISGFSQDCNGNTIPDECEVMVDCNENGIMDECDIISGFSLDVVCIDGIPDECQDLSDPDADGFASGCDNCPDDFNPDQSDCDGDGLGDICAIAQGMSQDCDTDTVPDECDPVPPPPCVSDLNGDCSVGFADILQVIAAWGACPPECPEDLSVNGHVGFDDILFVIGWWGPCPQLPTVACCLPDASCLERTEGDCNAAGGSSQGAGSTCTPNPCPQTGACCFDDGSCTFGFVADCATAGGTYQGHGVTCAAANCPLPGACCFADGACTEEAVIGGAACVAAGGTYQGDDTDCVSVTCPGGACCLGDGTCSDEATLAHCTAAGGAWQGAGTTCAAANCPLPGACCFDDGTCDQNAVIGGAVCVAAGGTYQGDDTDCVSVTCPGGACCLGDGTCSDEATLADCTATGGVWQGAGTTCAPNPCPIPPTCLFADPVPFDAGIEPYSVASGDLDGDMDLDLAVANWLSDDVSVLLNNGDGTFAAQVTYALTVGGAPASVAMGDLDNDGDLDLAITLYLTDEVAALLNDGNGSFAAPAMYVVQGEPSRIAIADLDGDGDFDLAASGYATDTVSILMNLGTGSFDAHVAYPAGLDPTGLAIGDVDGDGDRDLVVSNGIGTVSILSNDGSGAFASPVPYPVGAGGGDVALADLDVDGDLDLAVANHSSDDISVLLNGGDGTFGPHGLYPVGNTPTGVAAGDLDADGDVDLVVPNLNDDNASILFNAGDGTFAEDATCNAGNNPRALAIGDLDGDCDLDVAVANHSSNSVSVMLNDATTAICGACCFVDGSCTVGLALDCTAAGGTYQGDNVACAAANCPQPDACRTWTQVASTGPSPRFARMAFDSLRGVVVLYGGAGGAGVHFDDTWEWDGQVWTQRIVSGPGGLEQHAMAFDTARGEIVLFGGSTGSGNDQDRTWTWDGSEWTERSECGPRPPARVNPSMAFDPLRQRVVMFGGYSHLTGPFGDTWEWDGSCWTQVDDSGPSARESAAMAYDGSRQRVVMHGGFTEPQLADNGIWEWDGVTWAQDVPCATQRTLHGMTFDEQTQALLIFGGYDSAQYLQDTWANCGPCAVPSFGPRSASAAYDNNRGVVVLFGGFADGALLGDTWEY